MLTHAKVSGKLAGPKPSLVGGPDWDREHKFDGDATGGLIVRDATQTYGAAWVSAVGAGQVLVSAGVGVKPAWSASPSLTGLTLSTPLAVGSGGTGQSAYAVGDLLYASGAAALSKLGDVATGSVLVSGGVGVAPAWSATPTLTSLTLGTPLAGGSGGTGISSYAVGDLLYASGAAALSKLPDVATGSVLVSGGVTTAPAWSANPGVTTLVLGGDVTLGRFAAGKLTLTGTTPMLLLGGTTNAFPAIKRNGTTIDFRLADDTNYADATIRTLNLTSAITLSNPLIYVSAPSISSGFGTSPSIGNNNGSAAFTVVVGSSPGSSGVLTLPAAATGWNCFVTNLTAAAAHRADHSVQTASTTTSVTIENQTKSTGVVANWTAGDVLRVSCFAY